MKKVVRIVSVLLLACLLCLTMSGCQALEDARAAQGFWIEEGQRFRLGDNEYICLPESDLLDLLYVEYDYNLSDVYVTADDVPVLLSLFYGLALTPSADGRICVSALDYGEILYFCHADYYPSLMQQLTEGFEPVGFCCVYTEWDDETYTSIDRLYRLTVEETAAIGAMLEGERVSLPNMASVYSDYSILLNYCSEDMMLQQFAVELCCADGRYFLLGDDADGEWIIDVPTQYTHIAARLLTPEKESFAMPDYDEYDYEV